MNMLASALSDPIDELVAHAARLEYDDVPAENIQHQKRRLLDNIACAFAGAGATGTTGLLALFRCERSAGQASVLGLGERLTLRDAVMQNSLMARAWDFCDVISPGYHPSSTDVPIALALGEHCRIGGREVLTAMAAGQDVALRINAAAQKTGFFYNGFDSNILAPIAGAIIAGRLLGLSETQLREAVGLAVNTSAGSFQAVQDKVLAVRLAQANATRNALESALLARAGFTGIRRVLGGELSFFRLFAQRRPALEELTDGLGTHLRGPEATCFKLYPSCGVTLALTDAAIGLARRHELSAATIATCLVEVSPTMMMLCGQRFAPGHAPEIEAMFSVQYVVANALFRRASRLTHFTQACIGDEQVRSLANRIEVVPESTFTHADECQLTVGTTNGATFQVHAKFGKGWPQNPPTDAEFDAKLRQCVDFSGLPLAEARVDAIARQVWHLEGVTDLQRFVREFLVCTTA